MNLAVFFSHLLGFLDQLSLCRGYNFFEVAMFKTKKKRISKILDSLSFTKSNFAFIRLLGVGIIVLFVAAASTGCKKKNEDSGKAAEKLDEATELSILFKELQSKLRKGEKAGAAKIARALLPNQQDVEEILRPEKLSVALKISAFQTKFSPKTDEDIIKVFTTKKERTVIKVHRATTEELVANVKGSTSFNEFPSGILPLAGTILKPKVSFYEIEMLEPGKEMGMKYHLFTKTKNGWKMMGPFWRVFMKKDSKKTATNPTVTPSTLKKGTSQTEKN